MVGEEAGFFALLENLQFGAIDGGHAIVLMLELRFFAHPQRMRTG
jgi:hypothetical protein